MILIKKKYSNQEVLNIGIDFALTCFGTISFEYPFMGIKVINFTKNHPFRNFKFSFRHRKMFSISIFRFPKTIWLTCFDSL